MYMTCTWHVHNMYTTFTQHCTWHVHTTCTQHVHNQKVWLQNKSWCKKNCGPKSILGSKNVCVQTNCGKKCCLNKFLGKTKDPQNKIKNTVYCTNTISTLQKSKFHSAQNQFSVWTNPILSLHKYNFKYDTLWDIAYILVRQVFFQLPYFTYFSTFYYWFGIYFA